MQKNEFCLDMVEPYITSFFKLTREQAEILVCAAKLYRDALWIIESEPQLSWIMLVSAIEVVAKAHIKSSSPVEEIFRQQEEELADEIVAHGGEELLAKVAKIFVDKKNITRKYKEFLMEFLPQEPPVRPAVNMQINWGELKLEQNSKNPLTQIYNYRSKVLHEGTPFPSEMCYMARGDIYELTEKPLSPHIIVDGGVQRNKPGPMMLSIFEYIVRNALLKWWSSCVK